MTLEQQIKELEKVKNEFTIAKENAEIKSKVYDGKFKDASDEEKEKLEEVVMTLIARAEKLGRYLNLIEHIIETLGFVESGVNADALDELKAMDWKDKSITDLLAQMGKKQDKIDKLSKKLREIDQTDTSHAKIMAGKEIANRDRINKIIREGQASNPDQKSTELNVNLALLPLKQQQQ